MSIKQYKIFVIIFSAAIMMAASATAQTEDNSYEKYRRSSVYSVLIKHPEKDFCKEIISAFDSIPMPKKFNDHNLSRRTINAGVQQKTGKGKLDDQKKSIDIFLQKNAVARRLVAKWFNRGKDGTFDMDLIAERGYYDASYEDIQLADLSIRGRRILADAGEELISNTYVLVNDIRYVDKSETADIAGGVFGVLGATASCLTGGLTSAIIDNVSQIGTSISQQIAGFKVIVTSYLYRLNWNPDMANEFYSTYYIETPDAEKKMLFDKDNQMFSMHYVGRQSVYSGNTTLRGVHSDQEMIIKVCTRALDKAIAQLQTAHEEFRVKMPLYSTDPITAKIGLKEGVTEDSRFEVLEVYQDDDGKISYKRVGVIKPIKIWDNRYLADEEDENQNSTLTETEFTKVSGREFYPGMLIREIKN